MLFRRVPLSQVNPQTWRFIDVERFRISTRRMLSRDWMDLPIWRGMFKEPGKQWQFVELENHSGQTEVRYIARGTHQVRVGKINIDSSEDDSSPLPP